MGAAIAHKHAQSMGKPYRGIVLVPPHLVGKWKREIEDTLPDVEVTIVRKYHGLLDKVSTTEPEGCEWYVMSRNTAKLEPPWKPAYTTTKRRIGIPHCPDCGAPVMKKDRKTNRMVPLPIKDLERKRRACEECGSQLWTHTHQTDRWPVAKLIQTKRPHHFDYLVSDEIHKDKGLNSAQGRRLGTLASACDKVIGLTGTVLGGYADHLRALLFRIAPATLVEEGLGYRDHMLFNERYGRIEEVICQTDREENGADNRQSSGSVSTRTYRNVKPGIMPTIMRHIIGTCIFLSLDEVADNLPALEEEVIPVSMDGELAQEYGRIEEALKDAIRDMVRKGDRRLLSRMLHTLLGYPDHPYGYGTIGYYEKPLDPTASEEVFVPVVKPKNLSSEKIRPKERALIDACKRESEEGRQVWVFVNMTDKRDVVARLQRLLSKAGLNCKVLRSHEVATKDREDWILKHGADADVIISHPGLVETGLDLFDKNGSHNFCTLIFYQTGYSVFTLRQASRRSWRIAQWENCKVIYFYYGGTMQARAMTLMGRKMNASLAVEGKFSSEGLAAMAGDESSMEMALAQSLVDQIDDLDAGREWTKVTNTVLGDPKNSRKRVRRTYTDRVAVQLIRAAQPTFTFSSTKQARVSK